MELTPFVSLVEPPRGQEIPLPPGIAKIYGSLQFPINRSEPYVIANFVSTLDGVVAMEDTGQGGGEISGHNQHDRMVMGILRAIADAVIVGAGTLRSVPHHLWTAQHIYPPLAEAYAALRSQLGKGDPPLNVIVTARGDIDLSLPVFASGQVSTLIVTTEAGARKLRERAAQLPRSTAIATAKHDGLLGADEIQRAVERARKCKMILVEGGPKLMGEYFAERVLNELFLTLAPQVAGRQGPGRPGLVDEKRLAPEQPAWGNLVGVKRAESHLFLRYQFKSN